MPALATRMSKRPCFLTALWLQIAPAAWSVTSKAAASPFSPLALSSLTRSFNTERSRALRITCAPAVARDCAIAQPRPRDAPLTRATLPVRLNILPPPQLCCCYRCPIGRRDTRAGNFTWFFQTSSCVDVCHAIHRATTLGHVLPAIDFQNLLCHVTAELLRSQKQ